MTWKGAASRVRHPIEEFSALVEAVDPLFPAINAYLDVTGDAERAVPYGDLAQAAMEARFELDRRRT